MLPWGGNHLRVIALGDIGWLFINNEFVSTLDLSGWREAGDVRAATGLLSGDEITGRSTEFLDFAVRPVNSTFGPESGALPHDPDGGTIKLKRAETNLSALLAEVSFLNPYLGRWDYGFFIRGPTSARWHAIVVTSRQNWGHYVQTGTIESRTLVGQGTINDLNTTEVGGNQLRLIAVGDVGWFFAKGSFVAKLDLGAHVDPGDVSVLTRFFLGDEQAGASTEFSDFSVWSLE